MFIRENAWMIRVVCMPAIIRKGAQETFCGLKSGNNGWMAKMDLVGLHESLHDPKCQRIADGAHQVKTPVQAALHPEITIIRALISMVECASLRYLLFNTANCICIEEVVEYGEAIFCNSARCSEGSWLELAQRRVL